jgi:hypothetical protein
VRIWFDTEFIEDGKTIDLLSIGLVREDDKRLYMENGEADFRKASPWVRQNVFPYLMGGSSAYTRPEIAKEIREFAGNSPEFWADFCAYDWVAICQLYGTMMQLPEGWPMFCLDVRQLIHAAGGDRVKLPLFAGQAHYAMADALYCKRIWEYVVALPQRCAA